MLYGKPHTDVENRTLAVQYAVRSFKGSAISGRC